MTYWAFILFVFTKFAFAADVLDQVAVLGSPLAKRGGTFYYNGSVSPKTLNPLTADDDYSIHGMTFMAETLLGRHEDTYELLPILAESYKVLNGQKKLIFKIRRGIQFHDGNPLTVDDVKFSFDVYKLGLYTGIIENKAEDIKAIRILDPSTIEFEVVKINYDTLARIGSLPIIPERIYGDKSKIPSLNKTIVGTGPYMLAEFKIGNHLILKANPQWWGRKYKYFQNKFNFDRIIFRFIKDKNVGFKAVEKGEIDFDLVSLEVYNKEKNAKHKTVKFIEDKSLGVHTWQYGIFLNQRLPIFQSAKVRLALQYMLNRELIKEKFQFTNYVYATGPWNSLSEYADPSVKPILYDPKKAQQLLKEDGWADKDANGILEKVIDGKQVEFKFTLLTGENGFDKYSVIYQQDLKNVGIILTPQTVEWNLFLTKIDEFGFDAFKVGTGAPGVIDYNPSTNWHSRYIKKGAGANWQGYSNPKVDKLLDLAVTQTNRSDRIQTLRRAYKIIANDSGCITWFNTLSDIYVINNKVQFAQPYYKYSLGMAYWWKE